MLVGTVDTSIHQYDLYAANEENRKTSDAIGKADNASKDGAQKISETLNEPHDEYSPSGNKPSETPGIHQVEANENSKQTIAPDQPSSQEKSEPSGTAQDKDNDSSPEIAPDATNDNGNSPKVAPDPTKDGKDPPKKDGPEKSGKKHGLWCTVNTDGVDAEIKKLKEEKQQIEQQIKSADNEDKTKELKRQLSQIEAELSTKDNDAYRRQHATYTYSAAG